MLGAIHRASEGVRGVRAVLRASRKCRYSGARRCIGGIRGHWGLLGVLGPSGDVRGVLKVSRVYLGLARSVGTQGPEGV